MDKKVGKIAICEKCFNKWMHSKLRCSKCGRSDTMIVVDIGDLRRIKRQLRINSIVNDKK